MRAIIFHNPAAGKKSHDRDDIEAALKLAEVDSSYVSTKKDGLSDALKKRADFFVVAGGDGTIGKVLRKMPDRSVPVGIVPLGTANNIARSLGIAGTPHELAECWRLGHTRRLDIGHAKCGKDDEYFIEAFGIGAIAQLLKKSERKTEAEGAENLREGRERLQKILRDADPLDVEIKIDGKALQTHVLAVEILNTPYTGPGLPVAADADPGDGKLNVVLFETRQRDALIDWLDAPQKSPAPVTTREAGKIELAWRNTPMRIDDEYRNGKNKERSCTIRCESKAMRILIPKPQAAPEKQAKSAA
jgi:diacylglycerol kinase family enzyme